MFFGNPVNGTDWSELPRELVHAYNPDFTVYCGIGTLVLALVALGNLRRSPRLQVLSILVIASTGVATNSYLLRLGYRLLPMFRASRVDWIAVIGCFAIAAMAASGLDRLRTTPWRTRKHLLVAIAIIAGIMLAVTLVLEFHGLATIEHYANKLLSFPRQHWYRLANLSRSGRVKEWAQTGQSAWLAFEFEQVKRGWLLLLPTVVLLILLALRRVPVRLRSLVLVGIIAWTLVDVTLTAKAYYVSQPPGSVHSTQGIQSSLSWNSRWEIS